MKDIALFFLPLGIILSFLLLSGVAMFQRLAIFLQKKSINFKLSSHKINISISSIISFYALLRLLCTVIELNNINDEKENYENITSLNYNRFYLKKIRLQRNFWILLLCSITWIFYIRFTYLLIYYREKVKESDEQYEKVLETRRENQNHKKKNYNEEDISKQIKHDEDDVTFLKNYNDMSTNNDETPRSTASEECVHFKEKSSPLDKDLTKSGIRQRK
ncbi:conserved Plasmodium protein, unknown function [Plasmodium sp. gorilla clade G3]|nr:conserved Plasmodium protein, unknown function [Plasmodium sp. gorilla clade G3]